MNENRSDSRRSADRAFQESLEKLQSLLAPQDPEVEIEAVSKPSPLAPPTVESEEKIWEEAGEDLEEYFQNQESDET